MLVQTKHFLLAVVALLVFVITTPIAYDFGHRAAIYLVCPRGLEDAAIGDEKPERNCWARAGRLAYYENRYGGWSLEHEERPQLVSSEEPPAGSLGFRLTVPIPEPDTEVKRPFYHPGWVYEEKVHGGRGPTTATKPGVPGRAASPARQLPA